MNMIELEINGDFDLHQTLECGQCFRWERITESKYMVFANSNVCIAERTEKKLILLNYYGSEEFWKNYFDLDTDYGKLKEELMSANPELKDVISYGGGIRILNQDFFEVLISFIISQNNNIPRIKKCIESLCKTYGEPLGEINGSPIFAFPKADILSSADSKEINDLKLGYRAPYIVDAAKKFIDEGIPKGNTKEKYEKLLSYKGVGPKVANCISLFGFRDLKAFPIDTWVRKIMVDMYRFEEKDIVGMQNFADENFGDLGGLAQQYLFYYYRDKKIK